MDWVTGAQAALLPVVRSIRLVLEITGAFWIVVGLIFAMSELITAHLRWQLTSFTRIRLTFSRYLSLALEFQLASDILSTSITPTWQEIGKLAATAVIRTALNYFLSREMRDFAMHNGHEETTVIRAIPAEERSV